MTATTTSENKKTKSFFSVRFKSKFSEDMKLFITNLVFQLLCAPVFIGVMLFDMYLDQNMMFSHQDDSIPFYFVAFIALILSIFMGLVIPMVNFRYLYNKSIVDMNYSLPLNNRQRFFADFSSGLIAYIFPFIIGGLVALIELLIGSCFIDLGEVLWYIPLMVKTAVIILIGLILLYTISVFAMTFAGSIFEALFSIAAVNIMIPLFIYLTWMNIVEAAHFGLNSDSVVRNYTFFTTSPIGVFGFIIAYLEKCVPFQPHEVLEQMNKTEDLANTMYFNFMLRTLIVIAVIIGITYLLYKRRKAEDVSKPYVYKAFYYIIMSAVIYSIVTAMKMTSLDSGLFAALVISGIIWFVMEVIRRRGFKRFWTAFVSFAIASGAVICVVKLIGATHGLGRAKYIPSASSVTDVEIDLWGLADINQNRVLHDKKIIEDAIALNQELVDRHFQHDKYRYELSEYTIQYTEQNRLKGNYELDEQEIRIIYYTKLGSAIVRQYTVPTELITDLCCDMYTDKEFAEQVTKEIYYRSLRADSDGTYGHFCDSPEEADYCDFSLTDKAGFTQGIKLSVEEGKDLFEALCRDYAEMTSDEFKNSEFYCYVENMIINSSCHNTIEFLEEQDITYKKSGAELFESLAASSSPVTITAEPEYVFPLTLYKDSNYENHRINYMDDYGDYTTACIKLDSIFSLSLNRNRTYRDYGRSKHFEFTDPEAVEKLLEAATPVVTGEKVLAELQIGSWTLYITDKNGDVVMVDNAKDSIKLIDNKTGKEYNPDLYY